MNAGADPVRDALAACPRADFLPQAQRRRADFDGPIDIGHGQTCSQPRTVEEMLRLIDVRPGQRVLDVGCGSGWTTALLARLTGEDGVVIGVELEPDLVRFGGDNLARTGQPWARIEQAVPGELGRPREAPYDRILVSAGAREVPQSLVDQLGDGGRMVAPVAGWMLLLEKHPDGSVSTEKHGSYRFVPLR